MAAASGSVGRLPLMNLVRMRRVPILEQLHLEEKLLRASSENWCIVNDGTDRPTIVMGISGKLSELVELNPVLRDQVPVVRRFSGGGTVIVDEGTIFVSFICNKDAVPGVQPYPQPIMSWTGKLYGEALHGFGGFHLMENDYAFKSRKFGGNAQSITKSRWIHHTSFLWDFKPVNMDYLKHPKKAPKYRLERSHDEFLCRIKDYVPSRSDLIERTISSLGSYFSVNPIALDEAVVPSGTSPTISTRLLTMQELEEAYSKDLDNFKTDSSFALKSCSIEGEGIQLCHWQLIAPMQHSALWQRIISLLKGATETKNLNLGKSIHAHLMKFFSLEDIESNYLVNLYAKCGNMGAAQQVFDEMPARNVVATNAIMAGYLHCGYSRKALSVFRMIDFGELSDGLNEYIFSTVLASCAELEAFDEGKQCHAFVLKSGLISHSYVKNALLHMYTRCSAMEDAIEVFRTVPGFNVFSFNSMINGFLNNRQLGKAKDILHSMVKEIACWDIVSYVSLLGLCSVSKDSRFGGQIHCQIVRRGMESSAFGGSAVIDMYGKCGDIQKALLAFNGLSEKNVVSWTAVMAVCSQNGCFEDALKLFVEIIKVGIQPNELTYAVVLNSCAGLSALRTGDVLNAHSEKTGYKAHVNVGNALINMYSKSGSVEDATKTFASMPYWDTISWNSMITAYSHFSLAREALETFYCMLKEEEMPTCVTFIGVLSACAHLGLVEEGFYYLNVHMKELRIRPGVEHYTCIICLLCRAGLLDEADRFMRDTPTDWDIVAWRTLLSACQVHKNEGLGYKVAEHILLLNPNDVGTYILVSNMYAKADRWDGVAKIRKLMRERDIKKEPGVSWIQVGKETHVFSSDDMKHPLISQISKKLAELIAQIKLIGYVPNVASVLHDVEDEQKEEYLRYHSEKLAICFGLIQLPPGSVIHVMKNLRTCHDCHTAIKLFSVVTNRKIVVRDANRFHLFENGLCSCDDYW